MASRSVYPGPAVDRSRSRHMGSGVEHAGMPIVLQARVRMPWALGVPFLWRDHSITPDPPLART